MRLQKIRVCAPKHRFCYHSIFPATIRGAFSSGAYPLSIITRKPWVQQQSFLLWLQLYPGNGENTIYLPKTMFV